MSSEAAGRASVRRAGLAERLLQTTNQTQRTRQSVSTAVQGEAGQLTHRQNGDRSLVRRPSFCEPVLRPASTPSAFPPLHTSRPPGVTSRHNGISETILEKQLFSFLGTTDGGGAALFVNCGVCAREQRWIAGGPLFRPLTSHARFGLAPPTSQTKSSQTKSHKRVTRSEIRPRASERPSHAAQHTSPAFDTSAI